MHGQWKFSRVIHTWNPSEFSREHEILREEIKSLQFIRSRLEGRVGELEEELKKVKEEAEEAARNAAKAAGNEEDEVGGIFGFIWRQIVIQLQQAIH